MLGELVSAHVNAALTLTLDAHPRHPLHSLPLVLLPPPRVLQTAHPLGRPKSHAVWGVRVPRRHVTEVHKIIGNV